MSKNRGLRKQVPPLCTNWCSTDHPDGWDVGEFSTTKVCRAVVIMTKDVDGSPVRVLLERFVGMDGDRVDISPEVVRLECGGALDATSAGHVTDGLRWASARMRSTAA